MLWSIVRHARAVKTVLIDAYSSPRAFAYAWATSQLCRLLRVPYVPILHGGDFPMRLNRWPVLSGMIFRHARINAAPSGYLLATFERHGYRCTLIPNAIEIEQYTFRLREILSPAILWVRAFDKIYHPELAIRVLAGVMHKYPQARLCMVGVDKDGSLARCRDLAASLGLAEKVEFTGWLSKKEWIARAADYDIFLNTTNFDNMPVSVIEAMALGLPVVSTNVGGLPYLIEHGQTGLLTAPNDISALTQAIFKLLDDPELTGRLSLSGRKKASTFAWKSVEPLWLDILNN